MTEVVSEVFPSPQVQSGFINDSNTLFRSIFNFGRENNLTEARKLVDKHRCKYSDLYMYTFKKRFPKKRQTKSKKTTEAGEIVDGENADGQNATSESEGFWDGGEEAGDGEEHTCNQCNTQFKSNFTLLQHVTNVHGGEKPFYCVECEKAFKDKKCLNSHIHRIHGEKKYTCESCGFSTCRKDHLRRHNESIHLKNKDQNGTNNLACSSLMQELGAELALAYNGPMYAKECIGAESGDSHYKLVHYTEKTYTCELCEDKFATQNGLTRHIRNVHEGVKDFVCGDCGQNFTKNDALKTHIASVHFGERPYQCNHCNKTFSQNGNLKRHVDVVHNHVKPYACTQCGKTFSARSDVLRHITAAHSKVKGYTCKQCDKKFFHKNHMHRHMKTKHNKGQPLPKPQQQPKPPQQQQPQQQQPQQPKPQQQQQQPKPQPPPPQLPLQPPIAHHMPPPKDLSAIRQPCPSFSSPAFYHQPIPLLSNNIAGCPFPELLPMSMNYLAAEHHHQHSLP